jgi:hypothetical protein
MTKPEHFRSCVEKNCNNCKNHRLVIDPPGRPYVLCTKHNFELPSITSRVLENYVCDDCEPYEVEG